MAEASDPRPWPRGRWLLNVLFPLTFFVGVGALDHEFFWPGSSVWRGALVGLALALGWFVLWFVITALFRRLSRRRAA
jgi:predicted permease